MKSLVFCCGLAIFWGASAASGQSVSEYSSMFVHSETGDILGWDIRLSKFNDSYRVTLFCGEGAPIGPVHAEAHFFDGRTIILPDREDCGGKIRLRLKPKGLEIKVVGAFDWEFVPRRRNFLADKEWR